MKIEQLSLIDDGRGLAISWVGEHTARYHAIWLRDNALDADSRNPDNGQRRISILDVPCDTSIKSASLDINGDVELLMSPGGKQLTFCRDWLWQHQYDDRPQLPAGWVDSTLTLWDKGSLEAIPVGNYRKISSERQALGEWLAKIREFGFARLTNVPIVEGEVCQVAELFGFVRETNYGRYFEVRSEVNPINLAYTGLGLQAHTDNPYRDPVPTLQLLACLENSADGGESIVVDGFKAAQRLAEESAADFELLSRYCARFAFEGADDASLHATQPMIDLGADDRLRAIRFNNRSVAPIVDVPYDDLAAYYGAYRHFAKIITDPSMEVRFKLQAGDLFIVDNQRVMHSRKAFSGSGSRWLQGCYADVDGLRSTLRLIEREAGSV